MTTTTQTPTPSANRATTAKPAVPAGFTEMTPLEMNAIPFSRRHTVLTPALLATLSEK